MPAKSIWWGVYLQRVMGCRGRTEHHDALANYSLCDTPLDDPREHILAQSN